MLLRPFFHAWERRLADATKDRVVRPFEWGLDWIPTNGSAPAAPRDAVRAWVDRVMADTDAFYSAPTTTEYTLADNEEGGWLTFPSAYVTPHVENNTVRCRYFAARSARLKASRYAEDSDRPDADARSASPSGERSRAAVLVL